MSRHRAPRRRRRGPRLAAAGSLMLAVLSASGLAVALAYDAKSQPVAPPPGDGSQLGPVHRQPPRDPGAAAAPGSDPDRDRAGSDAAHWQGVVAELDRARAAAYAAAEPAALAAVYAAGSGVLRQDRAALLRYARDGARIEGLAMEVAEVRLVRRESGMVLLEVTDRIAGGRLVSSDGAAQELRDDGWVTQRMRLVRTREGWRIAAVHPL